MNSYRSRSLCRFLLLWGSAGLLLLAAGASFAQAKARVPAVARQAELRKVLEETFEVYECVFNIFDVVRTICAHVKRMVQHNRHKAPSSY